MKHNYPILLLISGLLTLVAIFMYQYNHFLSIEKLYSDIESQADHLKQLNSNTHRELLRVKYKESKNYDSLMVLKSQQHSVYSEINNNLQLVFSDLSEELKQDLETIKEKQDKFNYNTEKFMSNHALFNNSLDYFLYLNNELIKAFSESGSHLQKRIYLERLSLNTVKEIMANQIISEKIFNENKSHLEKILLLDAFEENSVYQSLLSHYEIIYTTHNVLIDSTDRLDVEELNNLIDLAFSHFKSAYIDKKSTLQAYKYGLIILITIFSLLLVYIIFQRLLSEGHLSEENTELQHKLVEQNQDLKNINNNLLEEIETRKQIEKELSDAAIVFNNSNDGIIICNKDKNIISVNKTFTRLTGYKEEEILGKNPSIFKSDEHPSEFYKKMWSSIYKNGNWQGEIVDKNKDGKLITKWLSIIGLKDDNNVIYRFIGIFRDITEQKKNEEMVKYQAHYDLLTGLPNRYLFNDRVEKAISVSRRERHKMALLFIDLDNFKRINDTMGHITGDNLLKGIAERLSACVRDVDTVARFGGDEFVIIMNDVESFIELEHVASRLIHALSDPMMLSGNEIFPSGSVGITVFPDDGDNIDTLIKNADMAMYNAKEHGKNDFRFYQSSMNEELKEYLSIENKLRHAIERDEFYLEYQPIVALENEEVYGSEALVRWKNPELGFVSPDKFISISEEAGFIISQGEWIFKNACQIVHQFHNDGHPQLSMSINISGRQFQSDDFYDMVKNTIDTTGVNAERICLEITENIFMGDDNEKDLLLKKMNQLKLLGVRISLDDFGTGYSSLSYLKKFPIDILKIDRSFIMDVMSNKGDRELVLAIIKMAQSLNIKVVAEGVESYDQVEFLKKHGCDYIQGYFYSKPLRNNQFSNFLKNPLDIKMAG